MFSVEPRSHESLAVKRPASARVCDESLAVFGWHGVEATDQGAHRFLKTVIGRGELKLGVEKLEAFAKIAAELLGDVVSGPHDMDSGVRRAWVGRVAYAIAGGPGKPALDPRKPGGPVLQSSLAAAAMRRSRVRAPSGCGAGAPGMTPPTGKVTAIMSVPKSKEVVMQLKALLCLVMLAAMLLPACGKHYRMGHPHGSREAAVERATEEVAALIERAVRDPGKAEQAKTILRQIVAEVRQSRQQNRQFHQALYELNADYHAEPEAFLEIIDQMNLRRMQTAGDILRLRFDMKALMTEAEWKAVTDGMADMRQRYQPGAKGKSQN